jgi:hypothetical protein
VRTVAASRYVTPLREGGSLPAIMEADDLGTYVVKFHAAAQGKRALVAEIIAGEIGRRLGLRVPEIVLVELDPILGRSEPDSEIRELVTGSGVLNLGLDFLPGALGFDPALARVEATLAAQVCWFDALVTNVDRTARNPNLLLWGRELYLIDHGAALYFHHDWPAGLARSRTPFPSLKDHVLLPFAAPLASVDDALAARLDEPSLRAILANVPDRWLGDAPEEMRAAYLRWLQERLTAPRPFLPEAAT